MVNNKITIKTENYLKLALNYWRFIQGFQDVNTDLRVHHITLELCRIV